MVVIVKWKNNHMKIMEWNWFLMVIQSIWWTTFMGQNKQKLIMGTILIKVLAIINNILI